MNKYSKLCLGLDLSERFLRYARSKRGDLDLVRADAHNIPLRDGSLELIVSVGLLEYVERIVVMKEMDRILKQRGHLIISVPNKHGEHRLLTRLFCKISRKKYVPKEPSKKDMFGLFKINRFRLIECRMDDGLIWLPDFLDNICGKEVYLFLEKFSRIFGDNPLSNVMLFIAQKCGIRSAPKGLNEVKSWPIGFMAKHRFLKYFRIFLEKAGFLSSENSFVVARKL
jgi:SAM-dependent methyltransferase